MEKYEVSLVYLLSKFSNANLILVYYSSIIKANHLMNCLCNPTRKCWKSNYKAFCNAFEYSRLQLEYCKEFDSQIVEYLLASFKYNYYQLTITAMTSEGIHCLITEFIEKINDLGGLKFKQIKLSFNTESKAADYNWLFKVFTEKDLDPSCFALFIDSNEYEFKLKDFDLFSIDYVPSVGASSNDLKNNISDNSGSKLIEVSHITEKLIFDMKQFVVLARNLDFTIESMKLLV